MFQHTSNGLVVAAVCLGVVLCPLSASSQEACAKDYQVLASEFPSLSDPFLSETADKIKQLQDLGLDPDRYLTNFENKDIPITVKYYILATRIVEAIQNQRNIKDKCARDVMPLRIASDLAIVYATNGLSALLPSEATRVDWAEIIKNGKPLGSNAAVIPKARDDLLNSVGLDNRSTPGKFIRNPKCIFKKC